MDTLGADWGSKAAHRHSEAVLCDVCLHSWHAGKPTLGLTGMLRADLSRCWADAGCSIWMTKASSWPTRCSARSALASAACRPACLQQRSATISSSPQL